MKEQLCQDMQVVVLMGGLGTRLGVDTPKSMVNVCGWPFFRYQFNLMRNWGFRKFVFCVGHGAEDIVSYFGDGKWLDTEITYSYDGETLLGTGGAIKKAMPLLEDNFMVIYGDSYMDINYLELIVKYKQEARRGKYGLMVIMNNHNQYDMSNVECYNGEIIEYSKKEPTLFMDYIDYGISIFRKEVFSLFLINHFDLSQVHDILIRSKILGNYVATRRFYEIGTPAALEEFKQYVETYLISAKPAIFLDRDGVINKPVWNDEYEQLDSPLKEEQVELIPSALEGLRKLQKNYLLFIVTNQPAAAKGKTSYTQLCKVNNYIIEKLKEEGINITDYQLCPHYPTSQIETKEFFLIQNCDCRKPKEGMIINLMNKYSIIPDQSWMIGDFYTDIECGRRAGVKTAFIGNYKCDTCAMLEHNKPDLICDNLDDFAQTLKEVEDASQ